MWKKILTISLVLAMVLSLAACVKEEEGVPSAQEIVDGVIASLDDIRTYQFDIDMTMDMAGEAEGEAFEGTWVTDSSGALDLENRKMRMDMTMSVAMIGEDEMEMGTEMYLIGDMVYMLMEIPEMEPMWMKSEVPEGYWEEMNQVESQIELLEVAQVEVIGSEMVGGIDCYVLQLTPDLERLWQIAAQQARVKEASALTEELLQEMFRSFSVKQWIAKDTYFLTKAEIDMAVELTPEAMGYPEEEGIMTTDIAMTFLGYDYNQPVSIVLPPEAEEEVGLPSAQEIVDGVIESLGEIRTYQFDMDMTMDMAGEAEGEAFEASMVMDGSGASDIENRKMRMDMTMSMAMIGEDEMEVGIEMYLIGDMMYMMMEIPEMEPTWTKSEMQEGYWEEMSQVEPQMELLEVAQVEVIGSEMVGGIDCYVLEVTPDLEQLWQSVMRQAGPAMAMPPVAEEFLQEIFRSFSVKQWVAKDTYFLTKAEINMAVELTPEAMGSPEEEGVVAMDIAMNLLAYNYNQPVSIELPPEAEEAVEVTM